MIEIMFPDGRVIHGKTYREVEDAWRSAQWTVFQSRRSFRREMRARAVLWGGSRASFLPCRTSKRFLLQLAKVGMLRIEESNEGRLI